MKKKKKRKNMRNKILSRFIATQKLENQKVYPFAGRWSDL